MSPFRIDQFCGKICQKWRFMKVLFILFPVHIVSTSFTYSFHILTILFPHPSHIIVILFTYGFHKGKNKKHFHNLIFNCNSSSIHEKVCWSVGWSVCWSVSHRSHRKAKHVPHPQQLLCQIQGQIQKPCRFVDQCIQRPSVLYLPDSNTAWTQALVTS